MDLAKIRKKSLQTRAEKRDEGLAPPVSPAVSAANDAVTLTSAADVAEGGVIPALSASRTLEPLRAVAHYRTEQAVSLFATPLEALLAGRTAAGCDDDEAALGEDDGDAAGDDSSLLEFLCFRVSDETYGINIMDIKEIIKPREVTEVPRAPLFISGVLSLRGTIIPIIDMRLRLGLLREAPTGKERIIVIKNRGSFSGLLVDEVIQVVQVQPEDVEAAPAVFDATDRDFINGIGHADGRLIILLNLENVADIDQ
jgi:purine-binding chemotaxis protein CheW